MLFSKINNALPASFLSFSYFTRATPARHCTFDVAVPAIFPFGPL